MLLTIHGKSLVDTKSPTFQRGGWGEAGDVNEMCSKKEAEPGFTPRTIDPEALL